MSNTTILVPFIEKTDLVYFFLQTLIFYCISFSILFKNYFKIHKTLQAYKHFKANSSHKRFVYFIWIGVFCYFLKNKYRYKCLNIYFEINSKFLWNSRNRLQHLNTSYINKEKKNTSNLKHTGVSYYEQVQFLSKYYIKIILKCIMNI